MINCKKIDTNVCKKIPTELEIWPVVVRNMDRVFLVPQGWQLVVVRLVRV